MIKITKKLSIALIAICLFSCEKENIPTPYLLEGKIDFGEYYSGSKLEARVITDTCTYRYPSADMDIRGFITVSIAETIITEDGSFQLVLPNPPSKELLFTPTKGAPFGSMYLMQEVPSSIVISDKNAKMTSINFFYIEFNNSAGYSCGDGVNDIITSFCYADRDFSIKGTYYENEFEPTKTYECHYKRGWNIVYLIYTSKNHNFLYTTQKPDCEFVWKCKPPWERR